MANRFKACGCTWLIVAVACGATGAAEAAASAQRPSLTFNTATVPQGVFEVEAGAVVSDGSAAVPLFVKYGLTDRLELEIGLDAVRRVDTAEGPVTSIGDLTAGVRARLGGTERGTTFAVVGQAKIPTADDRAGSGEADVGFAGIFSVPIDRAVLDVNLWAIAQGRGDGRAAGQVQAIATLYAPPSGAWTPFVEAAWQTTAGGGDGGYVDAGVSYAASPRVVLDAAAGAGWSDGFPDWSATVGWTFVLGRVER